MRGAAKRVLLEVVGWVLVLAGIAALILPGPGLLLLAAGLFVLSQQYEWAERRVDPILDRALIGAATGVESLWKVAALRAVRAGAGRVRSAVDHVARPRRTGGPSRSRCGCPGGLPTGITQIASAVVALGLIVWSYRRYHGKPERVAELRERAAARS